MRSTDADAICFLSLQIVSTLLQERTKQKIAFMPAGAAMCPALLQSLPPAALPTDICGTDQWSYSNKAYLV
jgi:hypothetical protein